MIRELDSEIERLKEAKGLLQTPVTERKQRHLSADARARISAAQKKRWIKQKAMA
jgi:hypothetical protein